MKRIFLLAAALCCISLYSCDNEQDLDNLSPIELEILELDNLIASQSGFDEEALIADLKRGVMEASSTYEYYNDGTVDQCSIVGAHYAGQTVVFFEDDTCWDCFSYWYSSSSSTPLDEPVHVQYTWRYDPETQSLVTEDRYNNIGDSVAKIVYYNAENHRLIIEGNIFGFISPKWDIEKMRMSCLIDVDPAKRASVIEEYSSEPY